MKPTAANPAINPTIFAADSVVTPEQSAVLEARGYQTSGFDPLVGYTPFTKSFKTGTQIILCCYEPHPHIGAYWQVEFYFSFGDVPTAQKTGGRVSLWSLPTDTLIASLGDIEERLRKAYFAIASSAPIGGGRFVDC